MSKKKKRSAPQGGKMVTGREALKKNRQIRPLARNLVIASVLSIAVGEVLHRMAVINDLLYDGMYILALVLILAGVATELGAFKGKNPLE